MTHSLKTTFTPLRNLRWMLAAATIVAIAVPGSANAGMARARGVYDGTWNVVFATTRGSSAGGGRVSGSVNRAGGVAVQVSVGASHASGGGRLAGNFGAGSWRGIIQGDNCS